MSELTYSTALLLSSAACVSAHSVEPSRSRLLAVPAGVDQRAPRPPAFLTNLPIDLASAISATWPAKRIGRAEHPAVVMIAANDPAIGFLRCRGSSRSRRRAVFWLQSDSTFICTFAGPGPT